MRRFVPAFVEGRRRGGRLQGTFPAAVLFADVSGFTMLTERAFAGGDRGAELLYAALRAVFDPMVDEVAAAGGFVAGFAGDSFTAVFPDAPGIPAAPSARDAARRILGHTATGITRTPLGDVPLEVRCGVAPGDVSFGLLRSVAPGTAAMTTTRTTDLAEIRRRAALRARQRHAWYFRGPAVDAAALLASTAKAARVATAVEPDAPGAPRLPPSGEDPELADDTLRLYFQDDLVAAGEVPELRHVAAVFAKLEGSLDHATLERLHAALLPLVEDHGGTLNKIDFGDKGTTLYLHFGAPRFLEHPEAAAVGFARALLADLLPAFPELAARIGVDAGRAYCGILGGTRRNEWTCTGNPVNTAARLMMEAAPGEAIVSSNVPGAAGAFSFAPRGRKPLKGRTAEVELHALRGRATEAPATSPTPFVGRREEIERVTAFLLRRLDDPGSSAALVIAGDEGLGKSRLVAESVGRAAARRPLRWVALRGDPLLHRGWSAVVPWLEEELVPDGTDPAARRLAVEASYSRLGAGADPRWRDELARTRPFVGELLGCRWEGSLYESLTDPGLRHANRVAGVVAILGALSAREPLVLTVDDAHALDACSADAVRAVAHAPGGLAVALVMTCRAPGDRLPLPAASAVERVQLLPLDPLEVTRTLAAELLEVTLRDDAVALVAERAQGNPAFTAMLLEHLRRTGCLADDGRGRVRLTSDPGGLPATVASLLTARLHGLTPDARDALKAGSVLGAEIHPTLLASLLGWEAPRTVAALSEATTRGLLAPTPGGGLAFQPGALRHAVDSLLMPAARAALHARALARAEEARAADDDDAEELARHARGAREGTGGDGRDLEGTERHYLARASARAHARGDYRSEARLATRLLLLTPPGAPERPGLLGSLWNVEVLLGRTVEAEALAAMALEEARGRADGAAEIEALRMRSILRQQTSRLDEAEQLDGEILRLADARGDAVAAAQALMRRASIWRARGEPARAREGYDAAQARLPQAGHDAERALILANQAAALDELGESEAAEAALRSALAEARERGDPRAVAFRLANLSGVLWTLDRAPEAERAAAEAVEISARIGARAAEVSARGHLGAYQLLSGSLDAAAGTFRAVTALTQEIDDPRGEVEATWHLAEVDRLRGRFADAAAGFARAASLGARHGPRDAAQGHAGLALVALDLGELGDAARAIAAARESLPASPRVAGMLDVLEADLAARRGDVPGAIATLRAAASRGRSLQDVEGEALVRSPRILLDAGRDDEAAAALEAAASRWRRDRAAMLWLQGLGLSARLHVRRGRAAAGERLAREADAAAAAMEALPLRVTAGLWPLFEALRAQPGAGAGEAGRVLAEMERIVTALELGPASGAGLALARCRHALGTA